MLRKSVGSMESDRLSWTRCGRSPLVGEYLHRLDSGELICGLCLASVSEAARATAVAERVHAGERSLPVEPRAA